MLMPHYYLINHPYLLEQKVLVCFFFVNPHVHPTQTIYIKALASGVYSVLMAKAAALALAATINDILHFNNTPSYQIVSS
jgi:hypothetical protein